MARRDTTASLEKVGGEVKRGWGGRRSGAGRKKGVPNKLTTDIKDAIAAAFEAKGGAKYLEKIATENPAVFCTLLGKILPTTVAGDPDAPLETISRIKVEYVDAKGPSST